MSDFQNRARQLNTYAANGTLAKQLGIGTYTIVGWLGGVDANGQPEPRIRMETMQIKAKGLTAAKMQYLRQYKNRLPAEALDLNTGLVILRVASTEPARTFPADTPVLTGQVKFWRDNEGTGFVTVDGQDYFIHHSEVLCDEDVFPSFVAGQKVNFIPSDRKGQAIACSVVAAEE